MESFLGERVLLYPGNCLVVLAQLEADSLDACVTDPPYGLQFMGKGWDHGVPGVEFWREVYRVLKPGAHLIAFGGTRTYHRMVCAIEDAGFEIRDQIAWLYGSGFPKSHDVSKGIDRAAGVERDNKFSGAFERRAGPTGNKRCDVCGKWLVSGSPCQCPRPQDQAITDAAREWQGWGTALKPAFEPIVLARKPLIGTVAANVLEHGTGALNIDGCRVASEGGAPREGEASQGRRYTANGATNFAVLPGPRGGDPLGRWPANVIHDGSEEVVGAFPDRKTTWIDGDHANNRSGDFLGSMKHPGLQGFNDEGSAARFFYTAKADFDDRLGSKHPTVKPLDLMQHLVRLVTPKGGTVLDPFAGTGTTGEAAWREGMRCVLIEAEGEYQADIRRRMKLCLSGPDERGRESIKAKGLPIDHGPLFA